MAIRIVQLGSPRKPNEGLRIGTVRRPPRGISKKHFSKLNYYDVWFPLLSPSAELLRKAGSLASDRDWERFRRKFMAEMKDGPTQKILDLLAALSYYANFSIGCYCKKKDRCHRSLLEEILIKKGALVRNLSR